MLETAIPLPLGISTQVSLSENLQASPFVESHAIFGASLVVKVVVPQGLSLLFSVKYFARRWYVVLDWSLEMSACGADLTHQRG